MKRVLTIVMSILAFSACNTSKDGWKLVWTEDFKGDSIDQESWSRIGHGGSDWNDMMSLREDLAFIEDGQLVLLGKVNDRSSDDTTAFVTGGVDSRGKKFFSLARFEVKAKFNCVNGFWPAIWLMPHRDSTTTVRDYAEIDIMEHLNADSLVYQTVHSSYTLGIDTQSPHGTTFPVDPGDWNVYATEVYRDSVCMYVNDVKTWTYPRMEGVEKQFPWADLPFYLILSNQLGGRWVGSVDSPEQLPSELRIDWVKVYQKESNQ